ncbi:hypothetical protein AB205_0069000, partial [Aquarana catesbeiana]
TVPGKPDFSVHQTSESSLQLQWGPPSESVEHILGYRLQFGHHDAKVLSTLEFGPQQKTYTATNVHKGAKYIFKMAVKGRAGFSEEAVKEFAIPGEAPKGYPLLIEPGNISSVTIQLNWLPPVLAEKNGDITKYTVAYWVAEIPEKVLELDLPSSQSSCLLSNLKPNTVYEVKIRAHTSKGPGPYSPSVQYRTFHLNQVMPKNFKVRMVTKTSVLLSWEFPENYNSITPYKHMLQKTAFKTQEIPQYNRPEESYVPNTWTYANITPNGDVDIRGNNAQLTCFCGFKRRRYYPFPDELLVQHIQKDYLIIEPEDQIRQQSRFSNFFFLAITEQSVLQFFARCSLNLVIKSELPLSPHSKSNSSLEGDGSTVTAVIVTLL